MLLQNICKSLITLLISCIPALVFSQTIKLSGRVTDAETTAPLVGASVTLSNSNKGVITDVEGKFFIQVEQGNNTV